MGIHAGLVSAQRLACIIFPVLVLCGLYVISHAAREFHVQSSIREDLEQVGTFRQRDGIIRSGMIESRQIIRKIPLVQKNQQPWTFRATRLALRRPKSWLSVYPLFKEAWVSLVQEIVSSMPRSGSDDTDGQHA